MATVVLNVPVDVVRNEPGARTGGLGLGAGEPIPICCGPAGEGGATAVVGVTGIVVATAAVLAELADGAGPVMAGGAITGGAAPVRKPMLIEFNSVGYSEVQPTGSG